MHTCGCHQRNMPVLSMLHHCHHCASTPVHMHVYDTHISQCYHPTEIMLTLQDHVLPIKYIHTSLSCAYHERYPEHYYTMLCMPHHAVILPYTSLHRCIAGCVGLGWHTRAIAIPETFMPSLTSILALVTTVAPRGSCPGKPP